jgi:hypothetical protein
LCTTNAYAKIHDFETTHLKSMGGTGVGAILSEESAFLNPASLAFFEGSSFYAQKDSSRLTETVITNNPKPKALGFVIADGNPSLSGSVSYVLQEEENIKRKRWGFSASSPLTAKSAFGLSVRETTDENITTKITQKYYQTVLGVSHSIDEKFSLGVVAYDPFKSKAKETKALLGVQYVLMDYITAGLDFGGDYTADQITKSLIYKGALQVKVLDDFFLRFGGFSDKMRNEKGNGYGLAWVQPKLSFEFAIKNTKRAKDISLNQTETDIKETSFAGSFRF